MKTFQQVFCPSFVVSDAIIEVSIKSKKWLLCCTYNPNKYLTENHLRQLQKQLEASSERSDHFLIMGDFNADVSNPSVTSFCTLFKLKRHCGRTDTLQESRKSQLHRFILN